MGREFKLDNDALKKTNAKISVALDKLSEALDAFEKERKLYEANIQDNVSESAREIVRVMTNKIETIRTILNEKEKDLEGVSQLVDRIES